MSSVSPLYLDYIITSSRRWQYVKLLNLLYYQ
uniref:Uncharacterized protein n=1 Tax=Myoviridae sp. cteo515 TaxID=2823550 RepID=A0A8S5LBG1_9CAUD|nr:MAG TPA: hypothetical protein [Myoviridae sp. cteo515]DAX38380.1 MAG TPA: hypothetical protein [Caudoviricetes sp.]